MLDDARLKADLRVAQGYNTASGLRDSVLPGPNHMQEYFKKLMKMENGIKSLFWYKKVLKSIHSMFYTKDNFIFIYNSNEL